MGGEAVARRLGESRISDATARAVNLPNALTLLRIFVVPVVVVLLLRDQCRDALWLFLAAGITDGLDGFIAKNFDMRTRLGAFLDPLADKLLIVATVVTLALMEFLPVWLAALIFTRDFVILSGAAAYYIKARTLEMEPTFISKVNTCLQIVLVIATIASRAFPVHPFAWVVPALVVATAVATVASGITYVIVWSRKAARL